MVVRVYHSYSIKFSGCKSERDLNAEAERHGAFADGGGNGDVLGGVADRFEAGDLVIAVAAGTRAGSNFADLGVNICGWNAPFVDCLKQIAGFGERGFALVDDNL